MISAKQQSVRIDAMLVKIVRGDVLEIHGMEVKSCKDTDFPPDAAQSDVHANVNNKFPKKFQSVEAPTAKTLLR